MNSVQVPNSLVKTTKSCFECRRRKIRCDGNLPCDKCVYYEVPTCQYHPRKRRRLAANRVATAETQQPQSAAERILNLLYPSHSLEALQQLSRDELLQLAQDTSPEQQSPGDESTLAEPSDERPESDDEREWNEPQKIQNPEQEMCDDVNGLSLTIHRRSYMGISSIRAIFRTMFKLRPTLQSELTNRIRHDVGMARSPSFLYISATEKQLHNAIPKVDEETCVNTYFACIHGMMPLIDETEFRNEWKRGERKDQPWLALLNMVLVLGAMLADESDQSGQIYYMRAKQYLDFELLGIGSIESVQALCLLGGLYLHYRNSPNQAYAIMGAAYRIAIGLGLHRQPSDSKSTSEKRDSTWTLKQQRRQLWWTLFCLDTWGSMTHGRPTLGRWDPETMNVSYASDAEKKDPFVLSLDCAREFCIIATRIHHRLAKSSAITTEEIASFDAEVVNWYKFLPPHFRQIDICPKRLVDAHHIMRNRYFSLRITLYRIVLLRYANAKVALHTLPFKEQSAIQTCRKVACEAIDFVVAEMETFDRFRMASSVWYIYQAALTLLLSLLVDPAHPERTNWQESVERSIKLFDVASPTLRAAGRSRQVVGSIYEICTADVVPDEALDMISESNSPSISFWNQLGMEASMEDRWGFDYSNWQYDSNDWPRPS